MRQAAIGITGIERICVSALRRIACSCTRLARDRSGGALILFAAGLPLLVGVSGLAVDAGSWYVAKRALQTAADAAALGGALQLAANDTAGISSGGLTEAERNGFDDTEPATIAVRRPPQSGTYAGNQGAVEAVLTQPAVLTLAGLFISEATITARAVAIVQVSGDACVLALNPTASSAMNLGGSTVVGMNGCVVAANSNSESAIDIGGNGSLTAEGLWTSGDYALGNSSTLDLTGPTNTHAWPLSDPYANLSTSVPGGACTQNNYSTADTTTISPGKYCNGMDFKAGANVTLSPGTYYVNKGNFTVNGQATLSCSCSGGNGVTIVLTSDGSINQIGQITINGGASVNLTAPSSGTYKGLLFVQDPRAPSSNQKNKFNGGANMNLTGGIYFRNQGVEYNGNNGQNTPSCTMIIADTVSFTGNATINQSGCADLGLKPITISGVALAE